MKVTQKIKVKEISFFFYIPAHSSICPGMQLDFYMCLKKGKESSKEIFWTHFIQK